MNFNTRGRHTTCLLCYLILLLKKNMRTKILTAMVFLLALCMTSQAQQDCGVIDCPGQCGRFIDQNGDGFCDHGRLSKPAAEPVQNADTAKTAKPADKKKTADKPAAPAPNKAIEKKAENETGNAMPQAASAQTDTATVTDVEVSPATEEQPTERRKSPYDLLLISGLTLGLYVLSALLVKFNVLKKATHRKIWNVVLLVTAIVSCLSGFFLVIQINYGIAMQSMHTFRYWHVQFGIPMTLVAVIHILWHVNYWKSLLRRNKQTNNS